MSTVIPESIPESHLDLAANAPVGILTTIGRDGSPQTTAVGYWFDGNTFRMSVASGKQKVKNLRRTPACTLFLLDIANVFRTLEIRGSAELLDDDDFAWAAKIAEGRGSTVDSIRSVHPAGEQRLSVALRPAKVIAHG